VKRLTVSLNDDTYERLVEGAAAATPPVSLQQMIRYAIDEMLGDPRPLSPEWDDWAEMVAAHLRTCPPDDTAAPAESESSDGLPELPADEAPDDPRPEPQTELLGEVEAEAPGGTPYGLMGAATSAIEAATERAVPAPDLSTFRVGRVWFGLAVDQVEGIAARTEIQSLPTVRNGLLGTIRYRDSLIAVFDAATVLGTAPLERDDAHHLVVRHAGALAALAVDEVGNLVPRSSGTWHPVPAGADELTAVGVTAIVDCGDRLVNVVDDLPL
jgi:chemotaxis signal transduction protein